MILLFIFRIVLTWYPLNAAKARATLGVDITLLFGLVSSAYLELLLVSKDC